jgi:hypothetical protein
MRAVTVTAIVVALFAAHSASAQQPPAVPAVPAAPAAPPAPALAPAPAPAPAPPAAPRAAQAPRPGSRPSAPAPPPAPGSAPAAPFVAVDPTPGQLVNIQIDVSLVVEGGTEGAERKTMTLTLADRQEGSVRSIERTIGAQGTLNVDARPVVQPNGRVLTRIGLEFQSGNEVPFVQVRAQPLLESGKALRISRAVSPKGDRSVTVEVTATILK